MHQLVIKGFNKVCISSYTTDYTVNKIQMFSPLLNVTCMLFGIDQCFQLILKCENLGKAVLLQAGSGPDGSTKLRFPEFMKMAQDGGKFVSLTHWPPLTPGNTPGTHFC